ncbi:hypothetical protein SLA2020_172420 [Shorea laevis]
MMPLHPHFPTYGRFNIFSGCNILGPFQVSSIKYQHSIVKVALSLGGDSVLDDYYTFNLLSVNTLVPNVSSLTCIIREYMPDAMVWTRNIFYERIGLTHNNPREDLMELYHLLL